MLWHFLGHTLGDKQQHTLERMVAPGLHVCNLRKRSFFVLFLNALHYLNHALLHQKLKKENPIYKHTKLVLSSGMAHLVL